MGTVEQLILDHYRTIQLPPDRIAEISESLKEALSARRAEAEADERALNLRIQRFNDERQKLLQLHYAEAVPIDLFKQEQERITVQLSQARRQLANVSVEFDAIEHNLQRALELASDCLKAYREADESTRRLFNQAFFEKLYVHDDETVTHELAEPFSLLLKPELTSGVESGRREEGRRRVGKRDLDSLRSSNENDLAKNEVGCSNVDTLVRQERFELPTFGSVVPRSRYLRSR